MSETRMLHHTRDICERLVYKKTTEGTNIQKVATYHSFETAVPGRADKRVAMRIAHQVNTGKEPCACGRCTGNAERADQHRAAGSKGGRKMAAKSDRLLTSLGSSAFTVLNRSRHTDGIRWERITALVFARCMR